MVDYSSQVEGCDAANVLDEKISNIWLSENGAPQWLCISLANTTDKDNVVLRSVGWHCWHSYLTNPKLVSMHVSSDGSKFKLWDTFIGKQARGTQLFSCAPVDTSIYSYVALEVAQTFGGSQTYMNRVFLYSDEVTASPTSSTEEQSISTGSYIESPEVHPNNLSDLSAMSLEHHRRQAPARAAVGASQDTDLLVEQLQDALGLRYGIDDSYVEDDHDGHGSGDAVLGSTRELHALSRVEPDSTSATVAERLTHLESTVNALGHTLIEHYSPGASATSGLVDNPSTSISRHRTPPLSRTTPASSVSPTESRNRSSRSPPRTPRQGSTSASGSRVDNSTIPSSAPLESVYQRMHSLEEKFSRLLDALEDRQNTHGDVNTGSGSVPGRRPPPPPPPPLPAPPSSAHTLASNTMTSISNVTSSSKSQRLQFDPALQPPYRPQPFADMQMQGTPRGSTGGKALNADPAVERVVHSIETMVGRVWDKVNAYQQHQLPRSVSDTLVRSSSGSHAPYTHGYTPVEVPAAKSSAEKATSPMRRPSEHHRHHRHHDDHHDNHHVEHHGEQHHLGHHRHHRRHHDEGEHRGREREAAHGHRHHSHNRSHSRSHSGDRSSSRNRDAGGRRRYGHHADHSTSDGGAVSAVHKYVSHNTERLLRRERVRQLIQSNVNMHPAGHHHHRHDNSSCSNSESEVGADHHGTMYSGVPADNVLDRSTFELLNSKYGLKLVESNNGGATVPAKDASGNSPAASLPMRAPVQQPSAAVVDWAQYVHNRVASRTSVTGELGAAVGGSPLRPGARGVYTVAGVVVNNADNIDVLPRAKQEQRDVRREREQQHGGPAHAPLAAVTTQTQLSGQAGMLPDWCSKDPEIAELVKALHHKVYQRTIKEAQYEMLINSQS